MVTIRDIIEALSNTIAAFGVHVNNGGNVHKLSDEFDHGFQSSQDKWKANRSYMYASGLDGSKKYKSLELDYGRYIGASSWFTDLPDDFPSDGSLVHVSVEGWGPDNNAKKITVWHPSLNRTWTATIAGKNVQGYISRKTMDFNKASGVSGTLKGVRLKTDNGFVCDIVWNLSFSDFSGVKNVGQVGFPVSVPDMDNRHYITLGKTPGGSFVPVGVRIDQGGAINVFKLGSGEIVGIQGNQTIIV